MSLTSSANAVFLEPVWKLPQSYRYLTAFPPDGYQFVEAPRVEEGLFRLASRWALTYDMLWTVDAVLPPMLLQSWLQRRRQRPLGTVLTYAHGHVVFRHEPWVVEVEYPSLLLGMNPSHLSRSLSSLERLLGSQRCVGIRCWSEAGRQSLTCLRNYPSLEGKVSVIPHAVPARPGQPSEEDHGVEGITLLFVGSANIKGEFEIRGGLEAVEAFLLLRTRYPNVRLVIRSDIPADLKKKVGGIPGIRVIEHVLSSADLDREFRRADIFLLPTHSTPPFVLLDAMSHGLPIVTLDTWANGEIVTHGKTGLLAQPSSRLSYYYRGTRNPNFGSREFREGVRRPDREVVGVLVSLIAKLVESAELRTRLGLAARMELEHGRLSIHNRNQALGRFLDEAMQRYVRANHNTGT